MQHTSVPPGGNAAYTFQTFKADVIKSLKAKFGNDVDTSHKKAIKISANGNRRSADVLVCQDFRRYLKYTGSKDDYATGVGFLTTDGTLIENYPKIHSANLTAKHQVTSQWLKPTIRILALTAARHIQKSPLPSPEGTSPARATQGSSEDDPSLRFYRRFGDPSVRTKQIGERIEQRAVTALDDGGLLHRPAVF
jgi:hypothetical protein